LCMAPMMDRNDSFSISVDCDVACAERVHESTALYFARVRCRAISATAPQSGNKENASATSCPSIVAA
jgi:hypothetical protein